MFRVGIFPKRCCKTRTASKVVFNRQMKFLNITNRHIICPMPDWSWHRSGIITTISELNSPPVFKPSLGSATITQRSATPHYVRLLSTAQRHATEEAFRTALRSRSKNDRTQNQVANETTTQRRTVAHPTPPRRAQAVHLHKVKIIVFSSCTHSLNTSRK